MPDLVEIFSTLSEVPWLYTDKRSTLKRITELCRQALDSRACTLTLVDPANDALTCEASTSPEKALEDFLQQNDQARIGRWIHRTVVEAGIPVEGYDLPTDGRGIANPKVAAQYNLQAALCHPLKSEGQLLGYLTHFMASHRRFTAHKKYLLKIFADQSVNVIERFEYHQTRDRLSQLTNALSTDLLALPSHDVLNRVAAIACELLSVPVGIVWTLDANEERLKVAAATPNVDEEYRKIELRREPYDKWTHLRGDVGYLVDVRKRHRLYSHSQAAAKRGWVSLLSTTLRAESRLIGMLDVYTERRPRLFKPWEREVFHAFANYAALAIEKAQFQEKQLVADVRATIDQLSGNTHSGSGNELDAMLHRIMEPCVMAVQGTIGHMRLLDTGDKVLALRAYYNAANPQMTMKDHKSVQLGQGIAGHVAETGEPYLCPDTRVDPHYRHAHMGPMPASVYASR